MLLGHCHRLGACPWCIRPFHALENKVSVRCLPRLFVDAMLKWSMSRVGRERLMAWRRDDTYETPWPGVERWQARDWWTDVWPQVKSALADVFKEAEVGLFDPELLRYSVGSDGFPRHRDRARSCSLSGMVHVGTLLCVSGTDTVGGHLEGLDSGKLLECCSSKSHLVWIPLAEEHRVTALTGGERVVLKAAVAIEM